MKGNKIDDHDMIKNMDNDTISFVNIVIVNCHFVIVINSTFLQSVATNPLLPTRKKGNKIDDHKVVKKNDTILFVIIVIVSCHFVIFILDLTFLLFAAPNPFLPTAKKGNKIYHDVIKKTENDTFSFVIV